MKERTPIPEIAKVVRRWLPNASDEKLKEATVNLRAYLAVAYRIFSRLESEGRLHTIFDDSEADATVEEHKQHGI